MKRQLRPSDEPHDFAYWVGWVVTMAAALFIVSMSVMVFGGVVVGMVAAVSWVFDLWLVRQWLDEGLIAELSFLALVAPVLSLMVFVGFRFVTLREWMRHSRLRNEIQSMELHRDIHEREGGHLVIKITGEVAKKQWPEIKRRLYAWEQEQEEAEETDG